jgi:hyperosmotically inducible protein
MHEKRFSSPVVLRPLGLISVVALTLGLVACDRQDNATVGQKVDAAVEKAEQAASDLKRDAGNMAGKVSAQADDAGITASINANLAKDPELSALKIDVDTKSGVVTLSGTAPNVDAKARATMIAQAVDGVAGVNNNLEVRAS